MSLKFDPAILPSVANFPAATPPEGVIANFDNPYTIAPLLYGLGSVFVLVMLCFVAARFYAKTVIIKGLKWDDLTCLIAMLGTIEQLITASIMCKAGIGTHQWDLKIRSVISNDFLIGSTAFVVTTLPTQMFAKLTFFLLYFQIFRPNVVLRRYIWGGAAVSIGFYVATAIAQFYYLVPGPGETYISNTTWDNNSPTATVGVVASAFNIFSDFYLFFLPAVGVWQLQMPKERKRGLIIMFATGLLACIVSIVGLVYRIRGKYGTDGTYESFAPCLLVIIELSIGISCSCMPAVKSVAKHHSAIFSGLGSYISLLRSRSSKGSSYRSQQQDYSAMANKAEIKLSQSASDEQYSMLGTAELGHVQAVKTSIVRGGRQDMDETVIHLRHDIHHTWDSRPVQENRDVLGFGRV